MSVELTPEDFYFDELGRMVFTREFHLKRGYCCTSGCRHCPFQPEPNPTPRPTHEE